MLSAMETAVKCEVDLPLNLKTHVSTTTCFPPHVKYGTETVEDTVGVFILLLTSILKKTHFFMDSF